LPGGIWSTPAYASGKVYFGPANQPILAFQFKNARLLPAPVAKSSNAFPYPGATPSISYNAGQDAIVWAVENTNPAVLYAYNAINLQELYNSNQAADGRDHFGAGNKFITPLIANGKVYIGTTNGVGVFGLLPK
jgi:outer membrane protein assembly factor BamB